ncbi:MAG: type IV pili twitching motility protein PilT, partial [Candidatus Omnitrophica bacterium]|nr:type IV pili twitching motility protein PilT [Candidatus Omnitrophota bacterium]
MKTTMEGLLRQVVDRGATDLHLTAGLAPYIRLDDRLLPLEGPPLSGGEIREIAYAFLTQDKIERFERWKELDFAFSIEGLARFRA